MLQAAWFIARKDVEYILRERETILWLFIMPIVFFYFIGTITSGFSGGGPSKERLAVQVPDDAGFLADEVVRRMEAVGYEVVRTTAAEQPGGDSRRLVIPEHFTRSVLVGEKATLRFTGKEAGLGQQYDELRANRAAYTVLADLVATVAEGKEPNPEAFRRLESMPRTLKVEVQAGGNRQDIPSGFEQAIPGILVMFTLTVLLTSGTATLVAERRLGVLRRLASTPISRGSVVLGKWSGRLALGFVQIAFAMAAGTVLFGMKWGPDLPMILLVLLGWGGLCASLALLLGSVVQTEGQAVAIGVLSSNALAALGGCWWPIEITPAWMQTLAKFLPTGWTMDAMHKLINFRAGAASALPHVAALFATALILGWLAARRFRFQ
jgi:ABC-type multidrug transport system permease subunit